MLESREYIFCWLNSFIVKEYTYDLSCTEKQFFTLSNACEKKAFLFILQTTNSDKTLMHTEAGIKRKRKIFHDSQAQLNQLIV